MYKIDSNFKKIVTRSNVAKLLLLLLLLFAESHPPGFRVNMLKTPLAKSLKFRENSVSKKIKFFKIFASRKPSNSASVLNFLNVLQQVFLIG